MHRALRLVGWSLLIAGLAGVSWPERPEPPAARIEAFDVARPDPPAPAAPGPAVGGAEHAAFCVSLVCEPLTAIPRG